MISTINMTETNKKMVKYANGMAKVFLDQENGILAHTIAEVLDIKIGDVNKYISKHKDVFIVGKDYVNVLDYVDKHPELSAFARKKGLITSNNTKNIFLLSYPGYMKLLPIIGGDKCWDLYSSMMDDLYIGNKENGEKIKELEKEVKFYNPSINDYYVVNVHAFSANYMLTPFVHSSNGSAGIKKSSAYKAWGYNFPVDELEAFKIWDVPMIDWEKPVYCWLMFDAKEGMDVINLQKCTIDTICNYIGKDDLNIELMSCLVNKRVKDYKQGKIYFKMSN